MRGLEAAGLQKFEVFAAVDGHTTIPAIADPAVGLSEGIREFIHHHAAVLAIGDLAHQRWQAPAPAVLSLHLQGLVAGLHLAHQFGVGSLGLDQHGDLHAVAAAAAGHQSVGLVFLLVTQGFPLQRFHAVFLHQQPAVAVIQQGRNEGMQGVGVVRQVHLRW